MADDGWIGFGKDREGIREGSCTIDEEVGVHPNALTRRKVARRFVEMDGCDGGLHHGVVQKNAIGFVDEEQGVIDVKEQIANYGQMRVKVGRDCVGARIARCVLVDMHEDVALKVGIAAIEVEAVVGGAGEDVVIGVKIGPGRRPPVKSIMSL